MTTNPISSVAKIENAPENPMKFFKEYLEEAEMYQNDTFLLFNLATGNSKGEVLNRTVVLRGHDDDGIIFVTERNSRKYLDIQENPQVSATFLWCYRKTADSELIKHQVRILGTAKELSAEKIKEFYDNEPLAYKIRSAICRCGEPVNWDELKKSHDDLMQRVLEGSETLPQNESYTVIHVKATNVDFYHSQGPNQMADRVVYRLEGNKWRQEHVFA
ncbi:pyridoxine/pyridoxamine 5'-phosphate oxidase 2-like isoform X2 [Culicoides brevitarsis]|uniref:pyridoxine/pyridoxamine 5'-phosphate oxidase 2-like isoform X2 n=1 Tax=Culicoides brevitarsis TaxID=469753 RepID=UPI00307BEB05